MVKQYWTFQIIFSDILNQYDELEILFFQYKLISSFSLDPFMISSKLW